MTDWKERAERAEAELARLRALLTRAVDHVSYGSRRSYDGVGGYKMREAASQLLLEIMAALAALYRDAPPAQPAEPQRSPSQAKSLALLDLDSVEHMQGGANGPTIRLRGFINAQTGPTAPQPPIDNAFVADGCEQFSQPAEPVQRLSDERAAFEAWHNEYRTQELVRRDDTYYNTHVRCRWEGWQARAIESALQPGWRDIESAPKEPPCA